MNTKLRHCITTADLSDERIADILERAQKLLRDGYAPTLSQRIIANLFFESSTRTRLSFTTAVLRSGGQVITADEASSTMQTKRESLEDVITVVSSYVDAIVLRHPEAGSAARVAAVARVPVINAGDGPNAHPTQTLVDLFAIQQALGRSNNYHIGFVGDLKYSRVIHSLVEVLGRESNITQYWISTNELSMPADIRESVKKRGVTFFENNIVHDALPQLDILVMTRVQKERFTNAADYERLKSAFILHPEDLTRAKPELKILAPLPRTEELPTSLDHLPQAYYFQQASFGVPVRAALLDEVING